jgi:hypothetical protein
MLSSTSSLETERHLLPLLKRRGIFSSSWISLQKEKLKGKTGGVEGQIQDRSVFEQ